MLKTLARLFSIKARAGDLQKYPKALDQEAIEIIKAVAPYTLLSPERLYALIGAARYVARNRIEGVLVECGVWRGGAIGAVALALKALGERRSIYLFDTFTGMPPPTEVDKNNSNELALDTFNKLKTSDDSSDWCNASAEEVRDNLSALGLDLADFHFVKGMVEDTIPASSPAGDIALLHLDTDWYESTKHEMEFLFPNLVSNGVLIVDDYADWQGSGLAVDEYLDGHAIPILLTRVEGSVVGVKTVQVGPSTIDLPTSPRP